MVVWKLRACLIHIFNEIINQICITIANKHSEINYLIMSPDSHLNEPNLLTPSKTNKPGLGFLYVSKSSYNFLSGITLTIWEQILTIRDNVDSILIKWWLSWQLLWANHKFTTLKWLFTQHNGSDLDVQYCNDSFIWFWMLLVDLKL